MREIYSGAWTVIAWLGEERDNSNDAIQLVQYFSDANPDNGKRLEARLLRYPDCLGKRCWMALEELMNRPYWHPLWIIQEVVYGSSALILRCGDRCIDWTAFCQGIGFLFDHLGTVKDSILGYGYQAYREYRGGSASSKWRTTSLHLVHQDFVGIESSRNAG
jgi:hypothetical protein